jgi:hypothetical protein
MSEFTEPDEDFITSYGEISGPEDGPVRRKPLRDNDRFRALTFVVLVLAILWIIGVTIFNMHPSKLTFTGFLAALIYYAGEFINWERPRFPQRPKRERRARHQWRDR